MPKEKKNGNGMIEVDVPIKESSTETRWPTLEDTHIHKTEHSWTNLARIAQGSWRSVLTMLSSSSVFVQRH